jgi:hypothetical protein
MVGSAKADPLPDWYIQYVEAGPGGLDELLERIGFERAKQVTDAEVHNIIDVSGQFYT